MGCSVGELKSLVVGLVTALSVATTASGEPVSPPIPSQPPKSEKAPAAPPPPNVAKARTLLDDGLKDYPSARFRDVHAVAYTWDDGEVTTPICGELNAKSAAGGYTGWKRFVVSGNYLLVEGGGFEKSINNYCSAPALPGDLTKDVSPAQ